MLIVDDHLLNLAHMQEILLRRMLVHDDTRSDEYKKTIMKIDRDAYLGLLDEIREFDSSTPSLEEEAVLLENIKNSYEQFVELRLGFVQVCEEFNIEVTLSDLSVIDIDYVDKRINVVNGYLINGKNIEDNKSKLAELNDKLYTEEYKKKIVEDKISDVDKTLLKDFRHLRGRAVVNGELAVLGVTDLYKEIDVSFDELDGSKDKLQKIIDDATITLNESNEKINVADVCLKYLERDSKQVMDEIHREYEYAFYRICMLMILKCVVTKCKDIQRFVRKRTDLKQLFITRGQSLETLGITYIKDPMDTNYLISKLDSVDVNFFDENLLNNLKKDIATLSERTDEMILQNNTFYSVEIGNRKNVLGSPKKIIQKPVVKEIKSNQLCKVSEIPTIFNLGRALEKTKLVVTRVCEMALKDEITKVEERHRSKYQEVIFDDNQDIFEKVDNITDDDNSQENERESNESLFSTMTPFEVEPLYVDLVDDGGVIDNYRVKVNNDTKEVLSDNECEIPIFWDSLESNMVSSSRRR